MAAKTGPPCPKTANITPPPGGGGWETADCALVTSSTGALQCRCLNQGTYTVIDVPDVPVSTGGAALSLAARVVFYAVCGLSVPLYLTVLLAVLLYRSD